MAPPRVIDVRRSVVLVGEVRVAPGPQAILDRVVCHEYPRLIRKACDVNHNTENRHQPSEPREALYERHVSSCSCTTEVGRRSKQSANLLTHSRVQELYESRGSRPGLPVLMSLNYDFCGCKATLNYVHALVTVCL